MKFRAFLKASHFGPTMLITIISFVLATRLWWSGPAFVIAFTVFLGQLLIGWSNDLYDFGDDVAHNRVNKPLVAGTITVLQLRRAVFILLPIAILANLIGPLGFKGGAVYLLGVSCGIAYNFYFKFSKLSPLPYAIACAALPASIFLAVSRTPPIWVLAVGSMLGVAFHFANVLKDLSQDVESAIGGLPQRLGKGFSILIIVVLIALATSVFVRNPYAQDLSSFESSQKASITVGGNRPVIVILPATNSKHSLAPLLIDLHGYSGTSVSEESFDKMSEAAQRRGVIYTAPNGLKDSNGQQFWNASNACCNFSHSRVNDAAYIKSLIGEISSKASVDPKRIYLFGHSNGHFMVYKFACLYPKTIAAIAGVSGAMDSATNSCAAKTSLNVLHIHGTSDEVINYSGGDIFGNSYTSAEQSVARWALIDKCSGSEVKGTAFGLIDNATGTETTPWSFKCPNNSVELWSVNGATHHPILTLASALHILDWLLAHPKK